MKTTADSRPERKAKDKGPRRVEVLGPVPNLEEHVQSDWWCRIFNSLYLMTDGDVVDDRGITSREVDTYLDVLSLSDDAAVLDLCCGQGRHSLELARRGVRVEGLDRSRYLVQRARAEAKRSGLAVKFREGDARKIPHAADSFEAVVLLGNSFGYFETVQDDLRILSEIFRVLKPWGKLLIDVAEGDFLRKNFEPRSWEWIDKKRFVCRERSLSLDENRLISREVITHVKKGVLADQFYAERLYSRESLTQLLVAAGCSDIVYHGAITPDSKRNQDLGMMERRLIVTAVARKDWTPVKAPPGEARTEVLVAMGDPSKPDALKPSAVFDDDDLYTVDRLKAALKEQEGFRFQYAAEHERLVEEVTRNKDKIAFVLNLCDEGYANDARKELHVPALLEMLNVPYTGGGPQCLAFCYDKSLVKAVARDMSIPVPEAFTVSPEAVVVDLPIGLPVIVKPNEGDSSFGVTQRSVAETVQELMDAIGEIRERFGYTHPILVEEYLTGADLSVGIIGNPPDDYHVLPISEEDYSELPKDLPRICGYEAKWQPDSPYWKIKSVPATIPENTEKFIVESCLRLFDRLACRDYCRFDWRLDAAGNPKLLEVNPNPGWCWDGHLAKMSAFAGLSYTEMLGEILCAAERRLGLRQ